MPSLRKYLWRWIGVIAPLLTLSGVVALRSLDPQFLSDFRNRVFDQYQAFKPRPYEADWHRPLETLGVGIIDIDEESLARYGQWPWPRDLLARLLGRAYESGAVAVAFDMVFAEPDRTSLDIVIPRLDPIARYDLIREQFQALQALDPTLTSNDGFLSSTLKQLPTVVLGFTFSNNRSARAPQIKKGIVYAGSNPFYSIHGYPSATPNLESLETAAGGIGSFNVVPDNDGIIRRVPLVFALGEDAESASFYPSLVAEVLRVVQGQEQSVRIKAADGSGEQFLGEGTVGIVKARIGEIDIPTDENAQILLWDSGPQPLRYLPAWQVLDQQLDPARIEGRILFVGTSAPGLVDLISSPLAKVMPGVEVHAQIAEQILSQTWLHRPDYATGLELVYIVVLGLLLIVLIRRFNAIYGALLVLAAVVAAGGSSWFAFDHWQLLFDPIYPALAALAVYLVGSIINFAKAEAERRRVRGAFSRYLSPALVEQLARHPEQLRLGGEMREMTMFFCDIRGFTTISEQFDPPGLTRFINAFLTPMTEIILADRGTIDKYIGDCIMAFWNAPVDVPDHAVRGCRSALLMFERLKLLNAQLRTEAEQQGRPFQPIAIGAGLNSGPVCVGNMGSDMRFDYSVLGDAVNLASRLESQSKSYGVNIIIGENTEAAIRGQFATLELDLLKVKGKHIPVRIHALLGDHVMLVSEQFQGAAAIHRRMLEAYRAQHWDDCEQHCHNLESQLPHIAGLYAMYRERLAEFRIHPPAADWDGVHTATGK